MGEKEKLFYHLSGFIEGTIECDKDRTPEDIKDLFQQIYLVKNERGELVYDGIPIIVNSKISRGGIESWLEDVLVKYDMAVVSSRVPPGQLVTEVNIPIPSMNIKGSTVPNFFKDHSWDEITDKEHKKKRGSLRVGTIAEALKKEPKVPDDAPKQPAQESHRSPEVIAQVAAATVSFIINLWDGDDPRFFKVDADVSAPFGDMITRLCMDHGLVKNKIHVALRNGSVMPEYHFTKTANMIRAVYGPHLIVSATKDPTATIPVKSPGMANLHDVVIDRLAEIDLMIEDLRGIVNITAVMPDWEKAFVAVRKMYQEIKDRPGFEEGSLGVEVSKVIVNKDKSFLAYDEDAMGRVRSLFEKMMIIDFSRIKSPRGVQTQKKQARSIPGDDARHLDRLRAIVKNAEELTVEQLAMSLGADAASVWGHLFEWAEQFKFKVKGNLVIFKDSNLLEAVSDLDSQFSEWKGKEKTKEGKT